jgi:cyclic beta-1,2-glucan synthetase
MRSYHKFLDTLKCPIDQLEEDSTSDDLYSTERLEQFAESFAKDLNVSFKKNIKRKSLRKDLKKNKKLLDSAYHAIVKAMQKRQSVSPASEWFVDNFHHVQDQVQEVSQNLTHQYYDELPVVIDGEFKGYPRVYAIALGFVAHTDNRIAPETLERFLVSFQKISPLLMGEIWALIITFRVVLLQHLTMRAMRLIFARFGKERADILASQLFEYVSKPEVNDTDIRNFLASRIRDLGRSRRAFIVRLSQRLREQNSDISPANDWIENKLKKFSTNIEQLTQKEIHIQATSQTSVGNIISSMRLISSLDWKIFFEKVNLIDPILKRGSDQLYQKMDFHSKDQYRHSIEEIAKHSKMTEQEVALQAILQGSHVGHHLIGEGLKKFQKDCGYMPSICKRLADLLQAYPTFFYLGSLTTFTLIFLLPVIKYAIHVGASFALVSLLSFIAILLTSEFTLGIIHLYVNCFIKPRLLPRFNIELPIPSDQSTMVVIPTLLTSLEVVDRLIERLEIHALANREDNIYFALIGDYGDAKEETLPSDKIILDYTISKIDNLNSRHPHPHHHLFHLFHRKRLWNHSEMKWIGWERKRGKLSEFNKLLRGSIDTTYIIATASNELRSKIKYVITLDSDTELPRGSAKKLISTIMHPLNQPIIDSSTQQVKSGYSVLQPRISVTATSAQQTYFAKISSGNTGVDPYTMAVSDIYQDLFKEGSFTGKGLYIVDTFEAVMKGRVPDNLILSHDLFEGIFARCALVSDVELYDDYPADYDTFAKRCHRWVRGDWQISLWILPWVIDANRKWVRNRISILSRWKIIDNLRRSLLPMAALVWLLLAWSVLPGSSVIWTALIALIYLFPVYAPFANGQWMLKGNITWQGHILSGLQETRLKLAQIFITLVFLPNQAWLQVDAIIRSLYRLFISKQFLLEWNPFAQAILSSKFKLKILDFINPASLTAFTVGLFILLARPQASIAFFPFFLIWISNPLIKILLTRSAIAKVDILEPWEIKSYRFYARSTWYFFEKFVSGKGHWLAPDNYQENPMPLVAYRTSPTNIGLQLLSYISAYDLGYIGREELFDKLNQTFHSLEKLPKIKGHFLNWYDIQSLSPLYPRYISTVDSGNLAGHLITLKQFLLEFNNTQRNYSQLLSGIEDTIDLIDSHIMGLGDIASDIDLNTLKTSIESLRQVVQGKTSLNDEQWNQSLETMIHHALKIESNNENLSYETKFAVIRDLSRKLINQCSQLQRDITPNWQTIILQQSQLVEKIDKILDEMNFSFLFDSQRKLFTLGYKVEESLFDESYYDLLASEARLASFVAIAKGDIPVENWFRLARQIASVKGVKALTSWSASMFEYLMPVLVMKRFNNTLLDQTYKSIVQRQIEYAKEKNIPWGISESAYNARDLQMNYQYGPFGVPGLGLKRGLSNELVISPYSTLLAAMIEPKVALTNLKRFVKLGAFSTYGFYEAIDYTVERLPHDTKFIIIQSYMAHHQGMGLVSINNILNKNIMQKRFHNDVSVKATELLLQERIPKPVEVLMPRKEEVDHSGFLHYANDFNPREYNDVNLSLPRTHLLSNGSYSVLMTSAGSGYSRWGEFLLTRWREDSTQDNWGQYYYIRNSIIGKTWSATFHPMGLKPENFSSDFTEDRVRISRNDKYFSTTTEIVVSPEDSVELRKITITNETSLTQKIDLTSFMELALARLNDDKAHPAFSKLFIQTKLGPNKKSLLASRRRRSEQEKELWAFHTISYDLPLADDIEHETNRLLFIGRGRTAHDPIALENITPLSNTTGSVLDPIFSLRAKFTIPPGQSLRVVFSTGMTDSESTALGLIEKYSEIYTYKRESGMAWTHAQIQLRHLNISPFTAHIYQKLLGRILYLDSSLRPSAQIIMQNSRTQSDFWSYGISGDNPIILLELANEKEIHLFKDLLKAHEYMRLKGVRVDLVVMNINSSGYLLSLQDELLRQVRMSSYQGQLNKHGGVFLLRSDLMPREDTLLFRSHARAILKGELGYIEDQLLHRKTHLKLLTFLQPEIDVPNYRNFDIKIPQLELFNGYGGFCLDTNEYVIYIKNGQLTPAPWVNVIANSLDFGTIITESGSSHTWSVNSRENRITPWSNDPVSDPSGEILYIRDEQTGAIWSPTPLPIRDNTPYLIRHGQGYSKFYHISREIEQSLNIFVVMNEEVKVTELTLKNLGDSTRYLSITNYIEWVLGIHREDSAAHIVTEFDEKTNSIFAHNSYNNEFSTRFSFSSMSIKDSETSQSFTCDRREFLGRNGNIKYPEGLKRTKFSNSLGAGLDPCTAWQVVIELKPGQEEKITFLLGQSSTKEKAQNTIVNFANNSAVDKAFKDVISHWNLTLGKIEIETPDQSMNLLMNRWLPYQVLSCRVWARTAMYQSGGAFGFRDQLQDVMAMVYSRPEITRQQILIHAKRQFKEGDVQHWWHPPTGRGVRTHFSDDLLWLPFVASFYIKVTGDISILDEVVPFIEGPLLEQNREDAYLHPEISDEIGNLYEHCTRAIDKSLGLGAHGLPLIGGGDWNDGMNRIGHLGLGESVWVAWFLYQTISDFLPFCEQKHQQQYSEHLERLKHSLEHEAWDGQWYRRAFFDDGTPVGSNSSDECKIDSISQSWAILSGAGDKDRALQAMQSVDKHLINWEDKIIKLFTPPFDITTSDPGYIKGYVPGVRENGGQYTHAAIWVLMAYAKLGDGEKATKIFQLLNPINHSLDEKGVLKYKAEPYALAADVYALEPHIGRAGWSWYTGSASWMYRAGLESILGFEKQSNKFKVSPKVPSEWSSFRLTYYFGKTRYQIFLKRNEPNFRYKSDEWIEFIDDEKGHIIEISF